jgi:adenosylcobinamide-GDP ribazoletransferase
LALAVGALLTGGLHEDGLADVADGFGGGRTRERKLEIMRDSRIGSYGVMALVLALLVKASAIAAMLQADLLGALLGLIAAGAVSRAAMVWLLAVAPAARSDGLGSGAGMPDTNAMSVALGIGAVVAVIAIGIAAGPWAVLVVAAVSVITALLLRTLALKQIGGQTGDVCGAMQIVTETAFLAALSAMVH